MTIDEKIAVLETAQRKLEGFIIDCTAEMNARVTNWAGVNGNAIPQLWATHGSIGDLLYSLREERQNRLDEQYDRAVVMAGGAQ